MSLPYRRMVAYSDALLTWLIAGTRNHVGGRMNFYKHQKYQRLADIALVVGAPLSLAVVDWPSSNCSIRIRMIFSS